MRVKTVTCSLPNFRATRENVHDLIDDHSNYRLALKLRRCDISRINRGELGRVIREPRLPKLDPVPWLSFEPKPEQMK